MKKIITLALAAMMMVGCDEQRPDGSYKPARFKTYIIDSCEYVGICEGSQYDYLAHKGNCKFCAERRKQELKELVEQLKDK